MASIQHIAERLTQRIFKGRARGNREGVEVHLSKAELSDLLEEAMKLAVEVGEPVPAAEPVPARKSLFAEHERMHLGQRGYSPDDVARVRRLAIALVESRVAKGEVDADVDSELKEAVKQAGQEALSAYNAALEYMSG